MAYRVGRLRGFEAYVPACALADIHYILHRNGLSGGNLEQAMDALFEMFRAFDTNEQDGKRAFKNEMKDFEDALIAESAYRNGIDAIITYNTRGFRNSPVKAMLPSAFTEAFKPSDYIYDEVAL